MALPSVNAMTTICSSRFLRGSSSRSADSAVLKVTEEPPVFSPNQRSEPEALTAPALRSEHCDPEADDVAPAWAEAED